MWHLHKQQQACEARIKSIIAESDAAFLSHHAS